MPNIKSAKKRVLVTEKKNADNKTQNTIVKNAIKKINALIDTNQIDEAEKTLPELYSALDKAVIKGVLHRNAAANKKSAIAKHIAEIKAGKKEVVIKKDNKTIAAEKAKAKREAQALAKKEALERKLAEQEAKRLAQESQKTEKERLKAEKKAEKAEKKAEKKANKEKA